MLTRKLTLAAVALSLGVMSVACTEDEIVDYAISQPRGTTRELQEGIKARGVCPRGYVQKSDRVSADWRNDCARETVKVCPKPYEVWDETKGRYVPGGCLNLEAP